MNIAIKKAEKKYVTICVDILQSTEIGTVHFSDYKKTVDLLLHALEQRELFVALNDNEDCLGFMYFMPKGVFGSYPYLHIIAVKEEYRNLGIGKQLIKYFEENSSDYSSTKCFLMVDDFNPQAKKLYESLGYQRIGELKDFYKDGITSYIMMKTNKSQLDEKIMHR